MQICKESEHGPESSCQISAVAKFFRFKAISPRLHVLWALRVW